VEWVPWENLKDIGPWGLVTLFVLLVLFGWLVPAKEMRYWRKAFFVEQELRRDLQATGQITRSVFNSLPKDDPE
jgi:ABC-type Fe3+ transport system permease subunit